MPMFMCLYMLKLFLFACPYHASLGAMSVSASDRGEPRTEEERKYDKRIASEMDRRARSTLSTAQMAVYIATKGSHQKKRKLREIYLQNGNDLAVAVNLFEESVVTERNKNSQSWVPMTALEVMAKYGEAAGTEIIESLKKAKQYESQPACPGNESAWLYKVYSGEMTAKEKEREDRTTLQHKARLPSGDEASEMMPLLAQEIEGADLSLGAPVAPRGAGRASGRAAAKAKGGGTKKEKVPEHITEAKKFLRLAGKDIKAMGDILEKLANIRGTASTQELLKPRLEKAEALAAQMQRCVDEGSEDSNRIMDICEEINGVLCAEDGKEDLARAKLLVKSAVGGKPKSVAA